MLLLPRTPSLVVTHRRIDLGLSEGVFFAGLTILSIILGAFVTLFIHVNLSSLLLRLFGLQEFMSPQNCTSEADLSRTGTARE